MNKNALGNILATGLFVLGVNHLSANPTGGQVAGGSASITTVPGTVTINQQTNTAIINWQTFSIDSGELTKFVQPSSSSATLNRVLGGQTSIINGSLQANGQVYLVNGNGIVVGPGGAISANTFIGSTRDIQDSDFLSGNLHFTGSSSAGVQNSGAINALGGDVYLIGKTVDNQGTVNAANGTAGLAAGDDVMLNQGGQEHVFVSPSSTATAATSQTAVHNSGAISAATAELKAANGNLYALAINNEGTVRATQVNNVGGRVFLTTDSGMIQNTGTITGTCGDLGGRVIINGGTGSVWNRGKLDASGTTDGGKVRITAQNVQNDGTITVRGNYGEGGLVEITHSGNALGSVTGIIDASGNSYGGSIEFLGTGSTSEAYLSLTLNVNGDQYTGGSIDIDSPTIYLTGATLTANGGTGGGRIFVGEGDPATNPTLPFALTTYVSIGTTLQANATINGPGGQIGVIGTGTSAFFGTANANGASPGTAGTVSITTTTSGSGSGSGGTGGGSVGGGTSGSGTTVGFEFVDPNPGAANGFGRPYTGLFNLSSNTTLITSPGDSFGGAGAGAAYLFSDANGALLSTIRGTHAGDAVGSSVQTFTGGSFAIETPNWNSNIGAITFGNGLTGFANGGGSISASNSLVGGVSGDEIGSGGLTELFNGNYLVLSPHWNSGAGAVTWVNPALGVTGAVSSANSLVGATSSDAIGSGGIFQLSNGANYLVLSPDWNGGAGAITNGSDNTGVVGVVSASNSLVGASSGDSVGSSNSIFDSGLGYYLVTTANWNDGAGAVTWSSASLGTTGVISAANSLVGSASGDHVGSDGITLLLNNHNYLVSSSDWNNQAGAVTMGNGATGISGVVSASNSLVGAASGDSIGSGGITVLTQKAGYVIDSPLFNNHAGAVSWASDSTGIVGVVSASNSLVGANSGDEIGSGGITLLSNDSFLVLSPSFAGGAGAVSWEDINNGHVGTVGSGNSLVGSSNGDAIGSGGIVQLTNGSNYLVLSPSWSNGKGAITNGNINVGVSGAVSASNSLVGAANGDHVGATGSITDFYTGYYLVTTAGWGNTAGAVTWNLDSQGTTGVVSATNSLVGSNAGDNIGSNGIVTLYNDDYVVLSPHWSGRDGAVTWGSATSGVSGVVSSSNSLVGASASDRIGSGGIFQLSNAANYLVLSPLFGEGKGAITNLDSSTATSGVVTSANSLVGSSTTDAVGSAGSIVDPYSDYYLVKTLNWNGGAGAVTWNSVTSGTTGIISSANSLVGSSGSDHVGSGGITILNNSDYLVSSPNWSNQKGAVTFGSSDAGVAGFIGTGNSLVGVSSGDQIGSGGITTLADGNYLVLSPHFGGGAGAVTWGDQSIALLGAVTASDSLVGASSSDAVGSGGILQLSNGANYLVLSPTWNGGAGAVTNGSDATGVAGVVSASNSLVGSSAGDGVGSVGSILDSLTGYYLVKTLDWNGNAGAITWNSDSAGVVGAISSANSLVGAQSGDRIGSGGIVNLANGNALILSPYFNGSAGAVTFANLSAPIVGQVGAANSLVGANSGDQIGSGGITLLTTGNYVVRSPNFAGGEGAVTFGSEVTGVKGAVSAINSLVGVDSNDHVGSGAIIQLPNGNYLVQSPLFAGSAGAVTWGSGTSGVVGQVSAANSLTGGSLDAGEQFAGFSADGSLYLISFTTDTSAGGDGRVFAGSVNGPTSSLVVPPQHDFFMDQSVISFAVAGFNHLLPDLPLFISNPDALVLNAVSVDALTGGAINSGDGHNIASGSSTSGAPGPNRLVTPGNGIWNIFGGFVHSGQQPDFVVHQLQLNLSPETLAHLRAIVFGHP
jgi:filamentous hemagglutinin family protein